MQNVKNSYLLKMLKIERITFRLPGFFVIVILIYVTGNYKYTYTFFKSIVFVYLKVHVKKRFVVFTGKLVVIFTT